MMMVMTTKTTKTILFASLIAAMILPFSGMNFATAQEETKKTIKSERWTEENLEKWQSQVQKAQEDNANLAAKTAGGTTTSMSTTFWTSSADCTHKATSSNHCVGRNTNGSFATDEYEYETPFWNNVYTHWCDTYWCVNTDIELSDQPQTLAYGGNTYTFDHATSVSCAPTMGVCSTLVTFPTYDDNENRLIIDAPMGVYIYHQTLWNYKNGSDSLWVGVQNNMPLGY
jgi:hypothetical protein